ncbi:MAG TPA: phosphoenolpyruvate synthase [Candidatus Paceibacterota bacterium]
MDKQKANIIWFKDLNIEDVPLVGGKNAALGEMYHGLSSLNIAVPNGFAITAEAYNHFLDKAGIRVGMEKILKDLDTGNMRALQKAGDRVRKLILKSHLPKELEYEIAAAYKELGKQFGTEMPDVAVRSSATAEDLPDSSFAGQQETYLNIVGIQDLLYSVKECIASLFTNRAISYRQDRGFSHTAIALSVGVQKMARSDKGTSGVAFSIDTETGFDKVVVINASYGLGEMIVQGKVTPDEFVVFKPTLAEGKRAIITRDIGAKEVKMIYGSPRWGYGKVGGHATEIIKTSSAERAVLCLTDDEVLKLADWVAKIEKYFSEKKGHYQPMDTEWAKDGVTGQLYIVQARPETVQATRDKALYIEYRLKEKDKALVIGTAVGSKISTGKVRIIRDVKNIGRFQKGEVLVTEITDPDWEPIMKIASAIVTDKGGRTSHAAIVSRELGITCIVGTANATKVLRDGTEVTVDSSGSVGSVYEGILPFEKIEHRLDKIPETKTKIMVNIGSPDEAFEKWQLPVKGVGLGRLEFIITEHIKIHPNALIDYEKLKVDKKNTEKQKVVQEIDRLTVGYDNKTEFYVSELAEGVAKIAAAFYPHEVIIRFSDFKTNEYRTLVGGAFYEPAEENPMIGWRGASRYYDPKFKEAFGLECRALKKVREEIGLKNVAVLIPFCRTPEEGKQVLEAMKAGGLERGQNDLKVYIMCEIPSNILLADEFLEICDGMSIGSNDLTQLTLGLDRDSGIVAKIANEKNPAVKKLIAEIIKKCHEKNKYIGICGQAPSDFPDYAEFLVEQGIDSMSLNPDTIIKTLELVAAKEKQLGK